MDKIEKLRDFMLLHDIDAIIIPTSDDHKSEYLADYWKTREWLTGFTGSAGTVVLTNSHAGLWTDSRYFIQAEQELNKPFVLHKLKTRDPEYIDWLKAHLNSPAKVGIDSQIFSCAEFDVFESIFKSSEIEIVLIQDPFQSIWENRPPLPQNEVIIHDERFCEQTRVDKIKLLQDYLLENLTDYIVISALDDIAWLLNLRGSDISYNPVFYSFVVVGKNETALFIDKTKLNAEIAYALTKSGVVIRAYSDIHSFIRELKPDNKIEIDINSINYNIFKSIGEHVEVKKAPSKISMLKTIKGKNELAHYKNAQIRDGIAVCKFLKWLEETVAVSTITEIEAANKLEEFRKLGTNYTGLSFGTISAYAANAALPHYSANESSPTQLKAKGLYLVDSGAQYFDGTTDITRTISLGEPKKEEITDFTLVLKGHINVAKAVFPEGVKGIQLDTLARTAMWKHGKDFGHGTGHGIGYFLNVHEGPQGFSQAAVGASQTPLEPGMLTTNEPGMYIKGKYGIRTENVLACIEHSETQFGKFLQFETMTFCPIDMNLIDVSMLNTEEIEWLNNYHKKVFELLSPVADDDLVEWLRTKTSPLK